MYRNKWKISKLSSAALILGALLLAVAMAAIWPGKTVSAYAPMPGAIFTTNSGCTGTNINIFSNKNAVYLDGGPAHVGAAGLPDGAYYVQVTQPDGALLGTSIGSSNETPVTVSGGEFAVCYQLSSILIKASDASAGYDDTNNPGGEYKVWVSSTSGFEGSNTKTDNFKVKGSDGDRPPPQAKLNVVKYYDANANGTFDSGETSMTGWKFRIQDGINYIRYTPISIIVDPDHYYVTEFMPNETNWFNTQPGPTATPALQREIDLFDGDNGTLEFGNLCLGAGGGLTLGFWSNKNGQAIYTSNGSNAMLVGLNLRTVNGLNFDPVDYRAYRTWVLSATATNMAYMLSAQLSAMELNVYNGKVNGGSLIYAPGANSANSLGFATVNDVMAEANTELGAHGSALSDSAFRSYQEALKNALDRANNNLNFVQGAPCSFSFPE